MKGFALSVALVLVVSVASAEIIKTGEWINPDNDPKFCQQLTPIEGCPVTPQTPIHVGDDDEVDVYYMTAPVFEAKFHSLFGKFGLFHVALGFYDRTTGENFTTEYDAFYEVPNATFPFVVEQPDGSHDAVWCNKGMICHYNAVNESYWSVPTAYKKFLARIPGAMFNKYQDWIKGYNSTIDRYETFTMWKHDDYTHEKPLMSSTTCDDFVFTSVHKLISLGAPVPKNMTLHRDFMNLFVKGLEKVDYEDPKTKQDILDFYKIFQHIKLEDLIEKLIEFADRDKFLYADGVYYKWKDFHFPWLTIDNRDLNVYDTSKFPLTHPDDEYETETEQDL